MREPGSWGWRRRVGFGTRSPTCSVRKGRKLEGARVTRLKIIALPGLMRKLVSFVLSNYNGKLRSHIVTFRSSFGTATRVCALPFVCFTLLVRASKKQQQQQQQQHVFHTPRASIVRCEAAAEADAEMNSSRPRQPFRMATATANTNTLFSQRPNIRISQILDDNSILDKPRPGPIPLSRRPPLVEVKNNASKRKENGGEQEKETGREKEKDSVKRESRTKGLPPPQQPPSALTALLLSHSCTSPTLPPLPTPPRSRQPAHNTALSAAQSVPAPDPASLPAGTSTSTPSNHLLQQLRLTLESSPPRRRSQPLSAAPSPPQHIATISLDALPSFTHHSEHAITSLHSPTHVRLLLRDTGNVYTVTPNTLTVGTQTYCIEDIPYKHLTAFRYVRRFVAAVRKRTVVAYGGVDGLHGRVWADGRGAVAVRRAGDEEAEVEFSAAGEPVVVASGVTKEELHHAKRLYHWLKKHPSPPPLPGPPMVDDEWELTPETRFVKAVGWCREIREGQWSMKFLDGVRVEIRGNEVLWISREGARKTVPGGLRDKVVRERVRMFVKAGV